LDSEKIFEEYQTVGNDFIDLRPLFEENRAFLRSLSFFYSKLEKAFLERKREPDLFAQINDCLLELARILVPVDYTRGGKYMHDPAIPIPPFPNLKEVRLVSQFSKGSDEYRFLKTQVIRERNKIVDAIRRARREIEKCTILT
jgi:hypothetical protein